MGKKTFCSGYVSECIPITSGVPQGLIIGPLLLMLFVNDIKDCFEFCNILLYDETEIC